jgi:hypothetical protein
MTATRPADKTRAIAKENIFLHRSHRKLPHVTLKTLCVEIGLLTLPFLLLIIFFYPELTLAISKTAYRILALAVPEEYLSIAEVPSYIKPLYGLVLPDRFPSMDFSIAVLVVSLLIIVLSWGAKQVAKPLGSWVVFICLIIAVSAAFFTIMPEKYPYTGGMFAGLYLQTLLTVWLLIPVILSLSLLPLPGTRSGKFLLIFSAMAYSIIFGTVRFAFFMLVLYRYSLLFMPAMIFAVGPLLDFVFVVGFYSFYVSRLSVKFKNAESTWQWLY